MLPSAADFRLWRLCCCRLFFIICRLPLWPCLAPRPLPIAARAEPTIVTHNRNNNSLPHHISITHQQTNLTTTFALSMKFCFPIRYFVVCGLRKIRDGKTELSPLTKIIIKTASSTSLTQTHKYRRTIEEVSESLFTFIWRVDSTN